MSEVSGQRLLWYDLETWGRDGRRRAICQFAAQLTDANFQPLAEPVNISCQLPADLLPEPEAVLVHGQFPASADAYLEREFCAQVHAVLSAPEQCIVGYNNIRFDDEFIRHLFFRNYYQPYAYAHNNGNSRWDLLDFIRACALLRPESLNWPLRPDGRISFKLEHLAEANNIAIDAHDALSDVRATIALARRIAANNRKLFDNLFMRMRGQKSRAGELLRQEMLLHVSGRLNGGTANATLLQPLWSDKQKKLHCLDLHSDSRALLDLPAEELANLAFSSPRQLQAQGLQPFPLKKVHLNKCPVLLDANTSERLLADRPEISMRMRLDWQRAQAHRLSPAESRLLAKKLRSVQLPYFDNAAETIPAYAQLYNHFIPDADIDKINQFRALQPEDIFDCTFEDERLNAMRLAYQARNYPDSLNAEQSSQYYQGISLTELDEFSRRAQLLQQDNPNPALAALLEHYQQLRARIAGTE